MFIGKVLRKSTEDFEAFSYSIYYLKQFLTNGCLFTIIFGLNGNCLIIEEKARKSQLLCKRSETVFGIFKGVAPGGLKSIMI